MSLSIGSRYNENKTYNPFQAGFKGELPGYAQLASLKTSPYSLPQFPVAQSAESEATPEKPTSSIDKLDALTFGIFSAAQSGSRQMNLLEKGSSSSWKLWKRRAVAEGGQAAMDYMSQNNDKVQSLEEKTLQAMGIERGRLEGLSSNFRAYSLGGLFGIGENQIKFSQLFSEAPIKQEWFSNVSQNFANLRLTPQLADGSSVSLGKMLKYNVGEEFFGKIVKFLTTGEGGFKASIAALGVGFTALKTYNTMHEAYRRSQAKGDNSLTSIFKTLVAGGKELAFFTAGCLAGNLAFSLAAAAIGVSGLSIFGGLAAAAFGGATTAALLKSVFGKPITDPDPDEKRAQKA